MQEVKSENIRKDLFDLRDEKYAQFNRKLIPTEEQIIGVRVPVLRDYAKKLYRRYPKNTKELLRCMGDEYYEEIMLRGMIIGLCKNISDEYFFSMIDDFVPYIRNWGICDVFCGGLKETKNHKEEMFDFLDKYLKSAKEFEARFALVMLTGYYVDERYIDRVLEIIKDTDNQGYYAKMAKAWLVSVCLVKFYEKTLAVLRSQKLDVFTQNKAIQKARESRRMTSEQKSELLKFKKSC